MTQIAALPCPVCKVALTMSERQGIEIDYCPQCRGVWLDRGELDKIIERSATDSPSRQPPPQPAHVNEPEYGRQDYRHGGYSQGHAYKKRKKSFFEELFD